MTIAISDIRKRARRHSLRRISAALGSSYDNVEPFRPISNRRHDDKAARLHWSRFLEGTLRGARSDRFGDTAR
jgi:hypothetical protein